MLAEIWPRSFSRGKTQLQSTSTAWFRRGHPGFCWHPALSDAGEIATTASNLNTFEVHAVVLSRIAGIGPAARGATKLPALPDKVRKLIQRRAAVRIGTRIENW